MGVRRRFAVLGCGRVGVTIVRDLAREAGSFVVAADVHEDAARGAASRGGDRARAVAADLADPEAIRRIASEADVVVGALPSRLGLSALRTVIACGKPYCDISFMAEDPSLLDGEARARGVCAVVDCGVAPGLANMIVGHGTAELEVTDNVTYWVGGLPRVRRPPFEYKAPFAPSDVLEEYVRPARFVEDGRVVVAPALSNPELIEVPGVGTLEAFDTDGLRSLLVNCPARRMREKTLRYPGHAALMRIFREVGLFSEEEITVGDVKVRPRDLTEALLFPHWRLEEGEREFTVLRVVVEGRARGVRRRIVHEMLDETDPATGESSMARTTGFPCAIVTRMLADGSFAEPGVFPPEILGRRSGLLDRVIAELAERGVDVRRSVQEEAE